MTTLRQHSLTMLAAVAMLTAGARTEAQSPNYKVVKTLPVGGDGGWDYLTVDPDAKRLYITRGSTNHTMVVDLASGNVAGDIADTPGAHGVAIAPSLGRGFTSNGRDTTV